MKEINLTTNLSQKELDNIRWRAENAIDTITKEEMLELIKDNIRQLNELKIEFELIQKEVYLPERYMTLEEKIFKDLV